MNKQITPYQNSAGKKVQVAEMFDNIAGNYDFLNHFLSMGIDILWRKKAIRLFKPYAPKMILDVATGTGDFAIESLSLNPDKVIGVDISRDMVAVGCEKIKRKNLGEKIELKYGDSEELEFESNTFDALTVAFGVRNFENLEQGLSEMLRVVKPGGHVAIIEFSQPQKFPIKQIYNFYFNKILPGIGRMVSKDARAYTYLPESVGAFPHGKEFLDVLNKVGYNEAKAIPLALGIASIYFASKK
ncbi:MAG: bifunctional demethylmenaquinone methyltransferase/2-methoxy-6-polyprenyl-1,4-benzoquinol methylase UbiE [Crocinitomicaceae bacterium]|nr:bifunctional demethylmenaquinone methyltransferase/2-methoxy-6-polyprenyl-1,4-benzoquinol methylase UbiE [Crocinitomicaceae bacterium]